MSGQPIRHTPTRTRGNWGSAHLVKPTAQPLPAWMQDKRLLPKRPPTKTGRP
jgi:hypothetical protein